MVGQYTHEQNKIITKLNEENPYDRAFLVNAGAGTGKTFTIRELLTSYFCANKAGTRISSHTIEKWDFTIRDKALYLVFNSAMAGYFKSSAKKVDIEMNMGDYKNLTDFVDIKTYHGFIKSNDNMEIALRDRGIDIFEAKINYAKGDLNKGDITNISRRVSEILNKNGILSSSEMKKYANAIKKDVEIFFDIYMKSKDTIHNQEEAHNSFVNSKIDINSSPLLYSCKDEILQYTKSKNITPESFFSAVLNMALDNEIRDKNIEIFHSYYYKRIFEYAMKNEEFLSKIFSNYDLIIIDEAQDADEKIFTLIHNYMTNNKNKKDLLGRSFLVFGDPKQAIYQFNGSFNIFKWADEEKNRDFFKRFSLTESFRYGEKIAKFGEQISKNYFPQDRLSGRRAVDNINNDKLNAIGLAKYIVDYAKRIKSGELEPRSKISAIFRTNAGCIDFFELIRKEIDKIVKDDKTIKGFSSEYVVLDSQIRNDLKNLHKKNLLLLIDNEILKHQIVLYAQEKFPNFNGIFLGVSEAIKDPYIKKLLEVDSKYDYLYKYKNDFLDKLLSTRAKSNALVVITNVHQSKGKEYDSVILGDDFLVRKDEFFCNEEEINISHTAITRARKDLNFYEGDKRKNLLYHFYKSGISPDESVVLNFSIDKTKTKKSNFTKESQNIQKNSYNNEEKKEIKANGISLSKLKGLI